MKIKECYISKNGITCFTDINSLVTVSKQFENVITKNNLLFYISLRCIEFVVRDLIKNKYILNFKNGDYYDQIMTAIIFS